MRYTDAGIPEDVTFARPRDVLHRAQAAIDIALTRRHGHIEEDDVLKAEQHYSQFASEAMRVETDIGGVDIDELLLQFPAADPVLDEAEVRNYIRRTGGSVKDW